MTLRINNSMFRYNSQSSAVRRMGSGFGRGSIFASGNSYNMYNAAHYSMQNSSVKRLNDLITVKNMLLNMPEEQRPAEYEGMLANIDLEIEELRNCIQEEPEEEPVEEDIPQDENPPVKPDVPQNVQIPKDE